MQRDVVERAMAGDHGAFAELAHASAGRLFGVARLILRDGTLAEDATQEALVAAWRNIHSLRDPDRFDAWMHRLLVHACHREARRERRTRYLQAIAPPGAMGMTEDPGLTSATRDQLARGFLRLDVGQRAAIVLHHHLGYSYAEVAAIMGGSPGTAKSRVSRGTVAMRAALDEDAPHIGSLEGRRA